MPGAYASGYGGLTPVGGYGGGTGLRPVSQPTTAPPGTVWDQARGGFVAAPPKVGTAAHAKATEPKFTTSPMGEVYQYNDTSGGWDLRGTMPSGGGGSSRSAGSGGGGGSTDNAALRALMEEVRNSNNEYVAPEVPILTSERDNEPYDRRAESLSYARAKDRTGLAAQAAMRGLASEMSQRGLTGSGIFGEEMADRVYTPALGQLAETDRQLAEEAADRAFQADQADTDRRIGQHRTNADYQERQRQQKAQDYFRKLELMTRIGGMAY